MTRAVLDANVLFSATLRDTLLWPAFRGVYEARFSAPIHEEWIRAALKQRTHLARPNLEATRDLMNRKIPGGLVEGFEPLIETLVLPDLNDRHVLALAVATGAEVIVTWNLADFPASSLASHGVTPQTPDRFLLDVLNTSRADLLDSLQAQRANLQNPPLEVEDFLSNLRRQNLGQLVAALEPFKSQL